VSAYLRQCRSFHRMAPPFLMVVYDTWTDTRNDGHTDRTTNLIISSNVHFVSLAVLISGNCI